MRPRRADTQGACGAGQACGQGQRRGLVSVRAGRGQARPVRPSRVWPAVSPREVDDGVDDDDELSLSEFLDGLVAIVPPSRSME